MIKTKSKKIIQIAWIIVAALIAVSMVGSLLIYGF